MALQWYVVCCKTNQEDRAEENLGSQCFEVYRPTFETEKLKHGEIVIQKESIFPDYLFVRFDHEIQSASKINNSYGVSRLMTFGNVLVPISEKVINLLKSRFKSKLTMNECDILHVEWQQKGAEVEIKDGIFAGIKAIFLEKDGTKRSIILLKLLGSEQRIKVNNSSIV